MSKITKETKTAKATEAKNAMSKKASAIEALKMLVKNVKDENLLSRIQYALAQVEKSPKKVTLRDLEELIRECGKLFEAPAPADPVPVEAAVKPTKSKKKLEPEEDEESDADADAEEPEEEEPQKPAKGNKKLTTKVKTSKPKTNASGELPCPSMFPEKIMFDAEDGEKELVCVNHKYRSFKEVREAVNNGSELYIAGYWTKRHIKKFDYGRTFMLNKSPVSFPDDLDLLNVVLITDSFDRAFAMSVYTEALYCFNGSEFEPVEDEGDDGKFLVRVSNGMEFELYEAK